MRRSCKVILSSQMDRLNNVSRRNTETVNGNNRTTDLYPQSVLPSAVSVVLVDSVLPKWEKIETDAAT